MNELPVKPLVGKSPGFTGKTTRITAALVFTAGLAAVLVWLYRVSHVPRVWVPALIGLAVNVLVLEWAGWTLWGVPIRLPARYYASKTFERSGTVYGNLGIRAFGRIVVKRNRFTGRRGDLLTFLRKTIHAETVHVLSFIGVAVFTGTLVWHGRWQAAMWTMFFNVPIHIYPIMLQRHNRGRVEQLLGIRGRTSQLAPTMRM